MGLRIQLSDLTLLSVIALVFGMGLGMAGPASSNACLDLIPQRAATITGVRGMFRQSGGAISIAMITLLLQYIGNMAQGFAIVFIGTSIITLMTIPFIFAMPSRAEPEAGTGKSSE